MMPVTCCKSYGLQPEMVDIDADPELRQRYTKLCTGRGIGRP